MDHVSMPKYRGGIFRKFKFGAGNFCRFCPAKILNFAIGGPYGHSQFVKQKSDKIISFGKMTWSHLTARIMMIEQLHLIVTYFLK